MLLDRVRREVQLLGDLAVRRAGGDQVEDLAFAVGEQRGRLLGAGGNIVIPSPTIRTAMVTSWASQSLDTNPDAPAARAA